ncbi:hypothetical protein BVD23_06705 [Salmonella enterica]|nr:hypothetical protein [Salmonella enterica]EAN4945064.1 hypothetical protein [Salmonella enterica]EBI7617427.1 hypothetical protein [Salmonella enterica]EBI8098588.1 hypothetical protein [Salmonella enterica]EBK3003924.1 hypothetical protein [Salmonella enterica]
MTYTIAQSRWRLNVGFFAGWRRSLTLPGALCSQKIGRQWRRQVIHGLRAATGAYTEYVRMTSTAQD